MAKKKRKLGAYSKAAEKRLKKEHEALARNRKYGG